MSCCTYFTSSGFSFLIKSVLGPASGSYLLSLVVGWCPMTGTPLTSRLEPTAASYSLRSPRLKSSAQQTHRKGLLARTTNGPSKIQLFCRYLPILWSLFVVLPWSRATAFIWMPTPTSSFSTGSPQAVSTTKNCGSLNFSNHSYKCTVKTNLL